MSFYSEFADSYEAVFPFRELTYDFLTGHLPGRPGRLLDIGCGSGHYCGRLARDGHEATGIDLDADMIAFAERSYPEARFLQLDMRHIHRLEPPFDLVFCIGNVASHLPKNETGAFLRRLARILCPGGIWILQVVNWDHILAAENYQFPDRILGDGERVFRRRYRKISPASARFETCLEEGGKTVFTGAVTLYPVRAEEMVGLHAEAGFELLGHYASYKRAPFVREADTGSIYVFRNVFQDILPK